MADATPPQKMPMKKKSMPPPDSQAAPKTKLVPKKKAAAPSATLAPPPPSSRPSSSAVTPRSNHESTGPPPPAQQSNTSQPPKKQPPPRVRSQTPTKREQNNKSPAPPQANWQWKGPVASDIVISPPPSFQNQSTRRKNVAIVGYRLVDEVLGLRTSARTPGSSSTVRLHSFGPGKKNLSFSLSAAMPLMNNELEDARRRVNYDLQEELMNVRSRLTSAEQLLSHARRSEDSGMVAESERSCAQWRRRENELGEQISALEPACGPCKSYFRFTNSLAKATGMRAWRKWLKMREKRASMRNVLKILMRRTVVLHQRMCFSRWHRFLRVVALKKREEAHQLKQQQEQQLQQWESSAMNKKEQLKAAGDEVYVKRHLASAHRSVHRLDPSEPNSRAVIEAPSMGAVFDRALALERDLLNAHEDFFHKAFDAIEVLENPPTQSPLPSPRRQEREIDALRRELKIAQAEAGFWKQQYEEVILPSSSGAQPQNVPPRGETPSGRQASLYSASQPHPSSYVVVDESRYSSQNRQPPVRHEYIPPPPPSPPRTPSSSVYQSAPAPQHSSSFYQSNNNNSSYQQQNYHHDPSTPTTPYRQQQQYHSLHHQQAQRTASSGSPAYVAAFGRRDY